jgi:hypothetical protein
VMIRAALTAGAAHASFLATPSNGLSFQQRTAAGALTTRVGTAGTVPNWLRLARLGSSLTASLSADGVAWTEVGTSSVPMASNVYIGLAVTSHYRSRLATASFDNVVIGPVANTPTLPPPGPVAAWSFDDGVGSVLRASIGGLDGTIAGATWSPAGRNGGALLFNGIDDMVTVPPAAALNLTSGMTVEAWVYPTALVTWRTVALKEGVNDLAYALYASDATAKPEGLINVGGGALPANGTGTLPLNTWSHLATTFDGSMQRLFLDGVQIGSVAASGSLMQTIGALRIGGNSVWGEFFSGALDDMRIYNRALSTTEIQTDMNTPVAPPPADTTLPDVAISTPVNGATVSGTIGVVATATDNVGVASVQFLLDGADLAAAVTAAPYTVTWDTQGVANGAHTLTAVARDVDGNANVSDDVAVTVSNDTTSPKVSISTPAGGATVSGSVTVTATATDDVGVKSVQFMLDGAILGAAVTASPYSVVWNTSSVANSTHRLSAVARDSAGNATVSLEVAVTVNNADTTLPNVAISTPASGSTVSGTVTVVATATDNVGVASVQFLLNGVNLGAADTVAPYSVLWNTTSVTNGTYTLAAVARDAAGNTKPSVAISVTVGNASPFVVGRSVSFTSTDHLTTLSDGRPAVSGYTLEVWLPGSNTSTGVPYKTSDLGKPASTTTSMTVDQQTFFASLPKGQEFFTTLTARGPGGSARSGASNSFMMQ